MQVKRIDTRYPSEQELAADLFVVIGTHFKIHREVTGTHPNGNRVRIDAVLEPLDPRGWKDERPALGLELKEVGPGFDTRNFMRWAAQAIDYTYVEWDGFGRLPIFTCPSPMTKLEKHDGVRLVSRLLGQLAVGELVQLEKHGWSLLRSEHRLWSEREGVAEASRWTLRPKVGSR